ncbi:hypothetical protein A6A08_21385 [Nocardiopsis sp. TSRI0078]|uniref:hypothetical protein n=1 Tax=unclassified Nocardiopsis TaxID=2649073 RepID=UPI00093F3FF0|nr:hypothetical protein [Nocardiopsis sp. TSRI0078]OKI21339.1 hypothetical protein A6A08_21385 [Nocardiopsis sp. TSRI0078]
MNYSSKGLSEPTQQQEAWQTRKRRLDEVIRKKRHTSAADALTDLWSTKSSGRPDSIKVRPQFVCSWRPSKDEDLVSPLLPGLIRSRGIALRFYLLALFAAQSLPATGRPDRPDLPFTQGGDATGPGWVDLIALDVAYHRGTGTYEPPTRIERDFITAYKRQITKALSSLRERGLIEIPTRPGGRYDYLGFTLMSELGSGPYQSARRYTVPSRGIGIPREFFTSGWINALTPSEIATWLALRFLKWWMPTSHDQRGVFLYGQTRETYFGLKKDAYQDSCRVLVRLGLLEDVTDAPALGEESADPTPFDQAPTLSLAFADLAGKATREGPYKPKRFKFTDDRLADDGVTVVRDTLPKLVEDAQQERQITAHQRRQRQ